MKLLLTALLFCTFSSIQAQKLKVTVDKIHGDTTYYTVMEKLYSKASFSGTVGELVQVSVFKNKKDTLIAFRIRTGKGNIVSVNEGDILSIKLVDGRVLKLKAVRGGLAAFNEVSEGASANVFYRLTGADILCFHQSKISTIRFESQPKLEYEIKDKNSELIMNSLTVISL